MTTGRINVPEEYKEVEKIKQRALTNIYHAGITKKRDETIQLTKKEARALAVVTNNTNMVSQDRTEEIYQSMITGQAKYYGLKIEVIE